VSLQPLISTILQPGIMQAIVHKVNADVEFIHFSPPTIQHLIRHNLFQPTKKRSQSNAQPNNTKYNFISYFN
jgi:hypothetical protein